MGSQRHQLASWRLHTSPCLQQVPVHGASQSLTPDGQPLLPPQRSQVLASPRQHTVKRMACTGQVAVGWGTACARDTHAEPPHTHWHTLPHTHTIAPRLAAPPGGVVAGAGFRRLAKLVGPLPVAVGGRAGAELAAAACGPGVERRALSHGRCQRECRQQQAGYVTWGSHP
jgi:hypothetical protein